MYSDMPWLYFLSIAMFMFRQMCIYRRKTDATRSRLWRMCYFLAALLCLVCTHGTLDGTKVGATASCPNSTFLFFDLWVSHSLFFYFLLFHFLFNDSASIETSGDEPYFVHFWLCLYLLGCLPALHGVHKYVQFHTLSDSGRNIGICVPSI